jgi:hypothetical protein
LLDASRSILTVCDKASGADARALVPHANANLAAISGQCGADPLLAIGHLSLVHGLRRFLNQDQEHLGNLQAIYLDEGC